MSNESLGMHKLSGHSRKKKLNFGARLGLRNDHKG